MSEFLFGLHLGHLNSMAHRIAGKHGACHNNYTEPTGKKRGWFTCPNGGSPHHLEIARAVLADIEAAGGFDGLRKSRRLEILCDVSQGDANYLAELGEQRATRRLAPKPWQRV